MNSKNIFKINKIKSMAVLLPVFMMACENTNAVVTPATPSPSVSSVNQNNAGKEKGSLVVTIRDGLNQQPVANASAKISLSDGTVLEKKSDSGGKVIFDGLYEGNSYNVEVSASGYINNSASTATENLEIKSATPANLTVNLFKNLGSLSGKIVSTTGQPIEAAVVRVGNDSALTSASGTFKVNVSNLTVQSISVSKIGYKVLDYGTIDFSKQIDNNVNEMKLTPLGNNPLVIFDTGKKPFGSVQGEGVSLISSLNTVLNTANFKTSFEDFTKNTALSDVDVIVLPSPSQDYSATEVTQLINFVKSGKKLVILGEWGGYGGFRVNSINSILKEANLIINPDIVKQETGRENDEEIISTLTGDHYITKSASKLSFYSSASVGIINGGVKNLDTNTTKLISLSDKESFRIQFYSKGAFGLIGVSTIGAGKVIAVGDASIFMNTDSNSNGKSNIEENDNKKVALNIFNW